MRPFLATILLSICFFGALYAQQEGAAKRLLHYHADKGANLDTGDSIQATQMVGNVKYYHNGAVITCDSAVLYADERAHFFGRVVLNQNTSYVYGDRMEYDGATGMARVFAPIVKVVDEDAVLYTYNFTFNTLDNIGRYYGGGTLRQAENHMESRDGFYYADERLVIGVGDVEMRNPDYEMQSDSVVYAMDPEVAYFFSEGKKTHIWTTKGEIIRGLTGRYDNLNAKYTVRGDTYFYNGKDEMWADSVVYASDEENLWLWDNVQVRNEENLSYLFGDFGQYWGDPQNAMMTQNPTALNIDIEKGDSTYLNADTLFLYTFSSDIILHKAAEPVVTMAEGETLIAPPAGLPGDEVPADPEKEAALEALDSLIQSTTPPVPDIEGDSTELPETVSGDDSTAVETPSVPLTKKEQRQLAAEEKQKAKDAKLEARRQKQAEKDAKILARRMERQKTDPAAADSVAIDSLDTAAIVEQVLPDSLPPVADSLAVEAQPAELDSLQRVLKAYYNVKILGNDMQAVCDSLVGFSADSTMHLYTDPIMWSGANQITAEIVDVYTKDGGLDRALFTGDPMMSAEVEPGAKYNQIKGLTMESFFRDNELFRHDVISNAQALYYMQDEETGDYQGFIATKASSMAFLLDSMQIQDIWLWSQVSDDLYPVDQIPESQPVELPGFSWRADRRHVLEDVFTRTLRDSEIGSYDSMPKPAFPLTEAILKDRDNKISTGAWEERNDRLTPETIEWIRGVDPDYDRDPDDEIGRGGAETIESPAGGETPEDVVPVTDGEVVTDGSDSAETEISEDPDGMAEEGGGETDTESTPMEPQEDLIIEIVEVVEEPDVAIDEVAEPAETPVEGL